MTERSNLICAPEEPATYDHLDVVLSYGMINEGCPNYGSEIIEGGLVIPERAMPRTDSLQKESDSTHFVRQDIRLA